jgi:hypothetical protein
MSSTRTSEVVKYSFQLFSYSVTIEDHASNNTMSEHRYNTHLIPTFDFEYYRLPLHDLQHEHEHEHQHQHQHQHQQQHQHKICQAFYRQ